MHLYFLKAKSYSLLRPGHFEWQAVCRLCPGLLSQIHPSLLHSLRLLSKYGYIWLHKTKMATAAMPNQRLQSGSPWASGWHHESSIHYSIQSMVIALLYLEAMEGINCIKYWYRVLYQRNSSIIHTQTQTPNNFCIIALLVALSSKSL